MIRIYARAGAKRAAAAAAAGLTAGAASAADTAADAAGSAGGWVVALLVLVVGTVVALLLSKLRRLAAALHDSRVAARQLADQLDVWQWRSGPDHRLLQLRPPQGTPASGWPPVDGTALWERFRCVDLPGLQACLDARAPIADLPVLFSGVADTPAAARIRGVALADPQGLFAGYLGTLRVLDVATPSMAPAVPVVPAVPAGSVVELADSASGEPQENEQESFSYTVSHDLRAPIRVVEGFTKILKEDYGRQLDRIGNDHLDRVLAAAARMNSMIDALLALSRLSTRPLARQPVNLSQLAAYVGDDLRRQSPDRHVTLVVEPGLQVQGDPTLLRVVLENLLGNAWKYTGKCRDAQIWFGRDPAQPGLAFIVRDNGAGFDMRYSDRLFGVFQRLHSATEFPGTGIGLASVRRIVRRHGGDIWADSEVDRGASFHFTLG